MRLKLYRAPSVAQAMAQIRAELGQDALILATRRVAEGVEVSAALEQADEEGPAAIVPAPPPPPSAPTPLAPAADPARDAALAYHGVPAGLAARLRGASPGFVGGTLAETLAGAFRWDALPLSVDGPPVLLVGPPGAGKTLTTARLATRLVMGGTKPLVVTADGKRAGAAEQLAAFTRLLGLTLLVADNPVTLARALRRRPADAPVLIDTAGADPFDPAQREEILALLAATQACGPRGCPVLVLPAGLDPAEAGDLAIAYAGLGATHLVATRLDLARRCGSVLAAAEAGRLALAEAGVGAGAADGLAPLTPTLLAGLLSGPPPSLGQFRRNAA